MPGRPAATRYHHDPDKPIRTPAQAITAGLAAAHKTLRREHGALTPDQLRSRCDGELRRLQDAHPTHPTAWAYWTTIHNTLTDAGHPTTHPDLAHLDRHRRGATWRRACTP